MTDVRGDGDCDDCDDSSLEFFSILEHSIRLFRPFRIAFLKLFFRYFLLSEGTLKLVSRILEFLVGDYYIKS